MQIKLYFILYIYIAPRCIYLPRAWSFVCSIRGSGIEGLLGGRSRRVVASLDREETAEGQVKTAKPQPLCSFIPCIYDPRSA